MNSIGEFFDNSNQLIDGIHHFFDRYIGNSLLRKSGIHKIVDKIMSKGYEYPDSPLLRLLGKNLKEVLRKNPNTAYVSDSIIKFTQEFKVKLVEAVNQGVPVRRFIQEAGYEYEMLGDDRVKTFVSRWRKEAREGNTIHAGYKERKIHPDLADYKKMTPEDAMHHMQNEILYLHQELAFIRKLSSWTAREGRANDFWQSLHKVRTHKPDGCPG